MIGHAEREVNIAMDLLHTLTVSQAERAGLILYHGSGLTELDYPNTY